MVLGLPGARGCFSALQEVMTRLDAKHRVPLQEAVHKGLEDYSWLATQLHHRPTRIAEVIQLQPSVVGAHNAAAMGAGRVFFTTPDIRERQTMYVNSASKGPIVWRVPFPSLRVF